MSVLCASPDGSAGVAYRMSVYLDCQARAIGENGFQAIAGGVTGAALLGGSLTIFVALIGYRLILGQPPSARDGVGWIVRLGVVIALLTSWPAFQTLVYRVAAEGPAEVAAMVLPASGLSGESLGARTQVAYDWLRLGMPEQQEPDGARAGEASAQAQEGLEPRPNVASLLVVSSLGLASALRVGIGFLLAVAPFAILGLLFTGTVGLFNGWLRAVAGLALALLGVTLVTSLGLVLIEGELVRLRELQLAQGLAGVDQQGLTTIVALFALVAMVVMFAGVRMGSALRLPSAQTFAAPATFRTAVDPQPAPLTASSTGQSEPRLAGAAAHARAAAVAEALTTTVHREQRLATAGSGPAAEVRTGSPSQHREAGATAAQLGRPAIGVAGRRGLGRSTRSAARRDRMP